MCIYIYKIYIYFPPSDAAASRVPSDLILDVFRSHSDTPYSIGFLWTSDQPDAETSTQHHTILTTDTYPRVRRNSRSETHALDRAASGIGVAEYMIAVINVLVIKP